MLGEEEVPAGWGGQGQESISLCFLCSEAHGSPGSLSPLSHFLAQLKLIIHKGRIKGFFHILLGLYFNLLYKHGNLFTAVSHSCKTLC